VGRIDSSAYAMLLGGGPPFIMTAKKFGQVLDKLRRSGFQVIGVDSHNIRSTRELLNAVGRALGFPAYFRPNWDAVNDSLGEWAALNEQPTALVLQGIGDMQAFDEDAYMESVTELSSVASRLGLPTGGRLPRQLIVIFVRD